MFIGEGSDLRIRNITFNVETGEVEPVVPDVRIDTWNHWILVAREAQVRAEEALVRVRAAHDADDNASLKIALEEEFRNGMVVISAAAFAVDAFYAGVTERYGLHPQYNEWQAGRLARYKQVSETFRWAWNIRPENSKVIRDLIRQLFKFRNSAVHSPAEFRPAIMRDDLDRGVEWRFVHFRAENSAKAIAIACELIEAFLRNSQKAPVALKDWIIAGRPRFRDAAGYEVRQPDGPTRDAIEG